MEAPAFANGHSGPVSLWNGKKRTIQLALDDLFITTECAPFFQTYIVHYIAKNRIRQRPDQAKSPNSFLEPE